MNNIIVASIARSLADSKNKANDLTIVDTYCKLMFDTIRQEAKAGKYQTIIDIEHFEYTLNQVLNAQGRQQMLIALEDKAKAYGYAIKPICTWAFVVSWAEKI